MLAELPRIYVRFLLHLSQDFLETPTLLFSMLSDQGAKITSVLQALFSPSVMAK